MIFSKILGKGDSEGHIEYYIDEFTKFRNYLFIKGWCFHSRGARIELFILWPGGKKQKVHVDMQKSPDVETFYGAAAGKCRFELDLPLPETFSPDMLENIRVVLKAPGCEIRVAPTEKILQADAFIRGGRDFLHALKNVEGGEILEMGSRARSGIVRRSIVPDNLIYTGFDILEGENVDVVGDAHHLSRYFPENKFDFIFSVSTFEHLLMPWKVVIEMNRVMKTGGMVLLNTHQSWPLHDEPCDFFRFSAHSWHALFNEYTGFKIVEVSMGEPCVIVSTAFKKHFHGLDEQRGYLSSQCVAQKVSNTDLTWNADPGKILKETYPA